MVHPLLQAANEGTIAAETALGRLLSELESQPPQFLSTIAINFWSPYLPFGRHTVMKYPKTNSGNNLAAKYDGPERLKKIHHRYLTLLGRNLSANHLLVEVPNVGQIIVDATAGRLDGPTIEDGQAPTAPLTLHLRMPLRSPGADRCFSTLVPKAEHQKWLRWIEDEGYERRFQGLLREELLDYRLAARRELPEAFANHLFIWIKKNWVPPHVGLGDFDDRWLARLQLTALAAEIWGDIWVSQALSLGDSAQRRLGLLASCTVTGCALDNATTCVDAFRTDVTTFAQRCSKRLQVLVQEEFLEVAGKVATLDHEPWKQEISIVENQFSHELGGSLIGADHESESICFRGVLTPGLDALQVGPTEITALHEIAQAEFEPLDPSKEHLKPWWDVWKAYFASNDLFLARDRVALHFELALTNDGRAVLPVPRHVVQLAGTLEKLFESIGNPPAGLLQVGFQTDKTMALHVHSQPSLRQPIVESRVQTKEEYRASKDGKGAEFKWTKNSITVPDWGALRISLSAAINLIITLQTDPFFKNAASSLLKLSPGQVVQLADGIAEVRHLRRGCLVFIGPVYWRRADDTYWFLDQFAEKRLEITRLGIAFGIVSQIPETFSEEFRGRLADAAAMDGETIVFTADLQDTPYPEGFLVDRPSGSIATSRFVQLPQDTPALLDMTKPKISDKYAEAWGRAAQSVKKGYLASTTGVKCKTVSDLERTELLSLGTRHRKAAMTTKCIDSVLAITCSASGKLKVWVNGVPIVELTPQAEHLLPWLSRASEVPETR